MKKSPTKIQIRVGDLRAVIREEYMRGVPEFMLREATSTYIATVRQHVQRYVAATQKNPVAAREAIQAANDMFEQLEEKANQLLEDSLWQFIQST